MTGCCDIFPWNRPKALAWFILFFATVNVIFLGGKRRAFGTFIAVLHKDFNTTITLTELNWIGDSYSGLGLMSSSLTAAIMLHFNRNYGLFQFIGAIFVLVSCVSSAYVPNPLWMFLTHTLLHGIGSSLVLSAVGLVVNEHFTKKHPYHLLATTLISGGSVAAILFVTFFAYLIKVYDWSKSFLILGGIFCGEMTLGAIFFRKNDELEEVIDGKRFSCKCEGINRYQVPLLVLWFVERTLTSVVTYGLLMNLIEYVYRSNPDMLQSTVLTNLFAGGEGSTYLIGAIITACTKDFFKNRLKYVLIVSSFLMSASMIILEFTHQFKEALYILCFAAGFLIGPSNTFLFPAGEEMTQLPGHIAYPFSLTGMGFGMLISPLLSAKIIDTFKYKWFFFVQGCLIFIKVICLIAMTVILWCYKRRGVIISYPTLLPTDSIINVKSGRESVRSLILSPDSIKHY